MKLLLKNCDILTSVNGRFETIRNGFLGIDTDTICYIGQDCPSGPYDQSKDMSGKLLIPGLINCHNHAAMVLLRGVGSDLPLQQWLFDKVCPIEDKLTATDIRTGSELALLEMIASGTTSFSDMYFEPQQTIEACIGAGLKANICRPVQCFDPDETYKDNYRAHESIALFKQFHNTDNGRIRVDFCIHAEYTCTEAIVRAYSEDCRRLGGRMHIHLSETKSEHETCISRYGKTPAQWFADLGTFDSPTAAAHCVWVTPEDIALLKNKGVSVIHNPTSNMKLGSGFAPVSSMLAAGLNITIGTDGAASNNNLNLFEEIHLASIIHNGYHLDPVIMNPQQVLTMATINGARLQGRDDTGELTVGKKADIVALDFTNRPHLYPAFEAPTMLAYSAQGSDVCMTMVDGRILYENGEFKTLDADRIFHDAKAVINRLY